MDESSAANPSLAALAATPQRTHIADRYRVLRVLGEGSSGIVYLCEHTALAKEVAVKVLHRELADNAALVARFTREAQTAARLDHPSSVHVMDFGQDRDGMLYLAMEYVDGPDLAQLLAENLPLDDARIVHFMSCILSALSAAHALGIVHRDLKPENVLVRLAEPGSGQPDVVKVCDFGVAQLSPVRIARSGAIPISTDTRRVTGEGMMVGTPWYMSPEQARADALDARSDIYSAGVVLFQLLTRTLPFVGDDVMAVAIMHCTQPPPPPSGYGAVHPGLEAVCLKALSKTPDARYQSANEMLSALRQAVATQVASRSLARTSRTSLARVAPVSARPELVSTTPLAAPSVREPAASAASRKVKPSLLVAGVATTLLGVAAVPRFLPSQHAAVVTTLSAAASRLDQTFGARGAPEPLPADAPIQNDPEIAPPSPLTAASAPTDPLPLAATELGLPEHTDIPSGTVAPAAPRATAVAKPAATRSTAKIELPAITPTQVEVAKPAAAALPTAAQSSAKRVADADNKPSALPDRAAASDLMIASAVLPTAVSKPTATTPQPMAAELKDVPESANEAAASAAEIALATLPPGPKAAALPPSAATLVPAAAPSTPAPAPKPAPVKFTRIDLAADHLPPGTSRASLRSALNQVALFSCYAQAQQRTPTIELLGTALELKTNTSGRVISAHATNRDLPHATRDCLEQVARSGNFRTGEGGEIQVTVQLQPAP